MKLEEFIISEVKKYLFDYESAFEVTAEFNDNYDDINYFIVTIVQDALPKHINTSCFCVKVEDGECEMELGDDYWSDLNTKNLFVFIYFDLVAGLRNN